jgi:hypothetical protein
MKSPDVAIVIKGKLTPDTSRHYNRRNILILLSTGTKIKRLTGNLLTGLRMHKACLYV